MMYYFSPEAAIPKDNPNEPPATVPIGPPRLPIVAPINVSPPTIMLPPELGRGAVSAILTENK